MAVYGKNKAESLILFNPILSLDLETTSADPETARIVEIGGVYWHRNRVVKRLRTLVNPGISIPAEATAVHGITDDDVKDCPTFDEVIPRLWAHLNGHWLVDNYELPRGIKMPKPKPFELTLVGYNFAYDGAIINRELRRYDEVGHKYGRTVGWFPETEKGCEFTRSDGHNFDVVDPYPVMASIFRAHRGRLETATKLFGVELIDAHTAVADAEATLHLLIRMIESGVIANPFQAALDQQQGLNEWLDWLYNQWGRYFYIDIRDLSLRVGLGRYRGCVPSEVPKQYWQRMLDEHESIPPMALEEIEKHRGYSDKEAESEYLLS